MEGKAAAVNDERDELDAFLDAGRARYGGIALAAALDDAATWTETRATRRRRIARTWIAGGVLAGLLAGGGAFANAMDDDPESAVIATSTALTFVSDDGATCVVELRPIVHSSAPLLWLITRDYLAHLDSPVIDVPALMGGGDPADREIATLTDGLSYDAEEEIFRRTGSRVDVTLLAEYSCIPAPVVGADYGVTPPVVGDDFGREPTPQSGRAPDVVGFFRASTGQICEIQMKVDPDWGSSATEADGALAARAFLASVDFTTVDYSAAVSRLEGFWPKGHDRGQIEASGLVDTLIEQLRLVPSPTGLKSLPISVEAWSHCDPEPSA